jgi:hypothetical protein
MVMSQDQLKDFFLKRLQLVTDESFYTKHHDVMNHDWRKGSYTLQDGGDFYKDGLFCEYSYIFDLDAKEKTLLLFTGFGKKPSKGYADWFYQGEQEGTGAKGEKIYVHACKPLTGDYKNKNIALAWMTARMERDSEKLLRKVLTSQRKRLPLYAADIAGEELGSLARTIYEYRMKGGQV